MHSLVLLVVPTGVVDVSGYVRETLERFRRNDKNESGRFDYYQIGGLWEGQLRHSSVKPRKPGTWENNSCPVVDLETTGGAVVTADQEWLDSDDVGLRLIDAPEQRSEAMARWDVRAREILSEQQGIVVAIDVHS